MLHAGEIVKDSAATSCACVRNAYTVVIALCDVLDIHQLERDFMSSCDVITWQPRNRRRAKPLEVLP